MFPTFYIPGLSLLLDGKLGMVLVTITPCGGAQAGGHRAGLLQLAHGGGEDGDRTNQREGTGQGEAATDWSWNMIIYGEMSWNMTIYGEMSWNMTIYGEMS